MGLIRSPILSLPEKCRGGPNSRRLRPDFLPRLSCLVRGWKIRSQPRPPPGAGLGPADWSQTGLLSKTGNEGDVEDDFVSFKLCPLDSWFSSSWKSWNFILLLLNEAFFRCDKQLHYIIKPIKCNNLFVLVFVCLCIFLHNVKMCVWLYVCEKTLFFLRG